MTDLEYGKILVTGATGFLGRHVVAALREADVPREVVALVRDPEAPAALALLEYGDEDGGVTLVRGDVLDADSVEAAVGEGAGEGCSAVIHCAGMVSRDDVDTLAMTEVNVEGVEVVLDACRRAGVRRAVVASTSGTIGISTDSKAIADEDTPTPLKIINRWPYYRSKYYGELAALARNVEDFEVVIVNPALLLGPGDLKGSSTGDVRQALEQRMPVVPSGGYAFVDARDAAAGAVLALDNGQAGRRYLLVACNCTVQTFFGRVARVADLEGPVFSLPDHKAVRRATRWLARQAQELLGEDEALPDVTSIEMSQHYWYVDSTRAENELGWRARDPMVTLADTVADLRERGVVMIRSPR